MKIFIEIDINRNKTIFLYIANNFQMNVMLNEC